MKSGGGPGEANFVGKGHFALYHFGNSWPWRGFPKHAVGGCSRAPIEDATVSIKGVLQRVKLGEMNFILLLFLVFFAPLILFAGESHDSHDGPTPLGLENDVQGRQNNR